MVSPEWSICGIPYKHTYIHTWVIPRLMPRDPTLGTAPPSGLGWRVHPVTLATPWGCIHHYLHAGSFDHDIIITSSSCFWFRPLCPTICLPIYLSHFLSLYFSIIFCVSVFPSLVICLFHFTSISLPHSVFLSFLFLLISLNVWFPSLSFFPMSNSNFAFLFLSFSASLYFVLLSLYLPIFL